MLGLQGGQIFMALGNGGNGWAAWGYDEHHQFCVNTIPCNIIQYHAIPCNTMQYHTITRNTMQYQAIQFNTMQCNAAWGDEHRQFCRFCPTSSQPPTNNLRPLLRNFFPLPTVVAADCWHHLILATAAVISSMLISFSADADNADIDDEGGDLDVSWSWSEEGLRQWVRTSTSIVVIRHHLDAQQQAFFFSGINI